MADDGVNERGAHPRDQYREKRRELDAMGEEAFRLSEKNHAPNFAILVLAIGHWASKTYYPQEGEPVWAIEACRRFFAASHEGVRKVATSTKGPPGKADDGHIFNLAADLLLDPDFQDTQGFERKEYSVRQAILTAASYIRSVPKSQVKHGEYNRLRYHWDKDHTRRLEAACERFGKRRMDKRIAK